MEFRIIHPNQCRLFQVADLICTLELISEKMQHGIQSKSEMEFFRSRKEFVKSYMRHIEKKKLNVKD